jgi:hypothetical protein
VTSNSRLFCTIGSTYSPTKLTPLTRTSKSLSYKKFSNSDQFNKSTRQSTVINNDTSTADQYICTNNEIDSGVVSKVAPVFSRKSNSDLNIDDERSTVLKYQFEQLKKSLSSLAVDSTEIDKIFDLLSNTTVNHTYIDHSHKISNKTDAPSSKKKFHRPQDLIIRPR